MFYNFSFGSDQFSALKTQSNKRPFRKQDTTMLPHITKIYSSLAYDLILTPTDGCWIKSTGGGVSRIYPTFAIDEKCQVASFDNIFVILTSKNKMFTLTPEYLYEQTGTLTLTTEKEIKYFEKNRLATGKPIRLFSLQNSMMVLTSTNKVFSNVRYQLMNSSFIRLDLNNTTQRLFEVFYQVPITGVSKIWSSPYSQNFFFQTKDEIYSVGTSYYGECSAKKFVIADFSYRYCQRRVMIEKESGFLNYFIADELSAQKVKAICVGKLFALLLDKHGKIYSCGKKEENGHDECGNKRRFSQIESLKKTKICQMKVSHSCSVVMSSTGKCFIFGAMMNGNNNCLRLPTEIIVDPKKEPALNYQVFPHRSGFYFTKNVSCISEDMSDFFESQGMHDMAIEGTDIKINKFIIQSLSGLNFDKITVKVLIENFQESEIKDWCRFIYSGICRDYKTIQKINEILNLQDPKSFNIEKKLRNLLSDNSTKDFTIYDKNETPIRAHKFVLMARSKTFSNLFSFSEGLSSIHDYTKMSKNALKALIEFIYSGKIYNDRYSQRELIELNNAAQFYQFNEREDIRFYLEKKKKK
ncbi:btb/poz domain-containing protein [Anaeramoeba flamelloides]|uniref:Btb/poz domain-containing protein n=1 Tax=Anaeramoeba flamelloides TaxID=1746091 RepID=A0ABQ8X3P2_9EUKA|nr:btb/poz domain-containing protein [Anaeramoeba flamelloides]